MASLRAGNTGSGVPQVAHIAAALNAVSAPIFLADRNGSICFVNAALSTLTGFSMDDLVGQSAVLVSGLGDVFAGVLSSGRPWKGSWVCPRKSGSAFGVRLSIDRSVFPAGDVFLVATIEAVEGAVDPPTDPFGERDFELFFNLIPDLACIAHKDGYFKRVNPAWEKTLGYTQEEVLSRPFVELVHPDDVDSTVEEALRQNRVYRTRHFVNRYRAKDGSYRLLEWTTTFNRDELTRFGVARDITEQRQWEESLRESEQRFRILADSCPTIIWVTDADGKIRLTNRTCREFFGTDFEHLHTVGPDPLIHPEDREQYFTRFREAVRRRAPFRAEARVRRADGEWRWISSYGEPRISAMGDFLGHVGISPDVTERKQAEDALQTAKLAAEAASRAKGEFLANMSHEIRTPMNAVIGLTDLALGTDLTADQRVYLEGVKDSAESLLRILNDILDFSKVEAGKLEFEIVEFDLRRIVESTAKSLGLRAAAKALELAAEVAPEVPRILLGDPARLRQILVNLIGNAIKFTERGEVVVHVDSVSRTESSIELLFTIRDTGIGIPGNKLDHVFHPFSQADSSTTRRFGGTGLGLTISSQLVEMMNGRVWVQSEEGRGSTFHFTARFGISHASESSASSLRGLRALVVVDSGTQGGILTRALESAGCRVAGCASAEAALAALQRSADDGAPFQFAIVDAGMPGDAGLSILQHLQADQRLSETRAILLSSGPRPEHTARERELGACVRLVKPVGELELLDAMTQLGGAVRQSATPTSSAEEQNVSPQLRILVVEDNPVNRLLATRMIERQNHLVTAVTNGKEALDRLETESFDCVLMDVQMPVMDGFEATAAIRRKEQGTGKALPVIAMTAHAMTGDLERCLAAGMNGYVTKPVNAADLFAAIDEATRDLRPRI